MSEGEMSDLEKFLQNGLATDILWCEIHYFVYRTLGENFVVINKVANKHFLQQVSYLQNSAHDLMLLHLARIFDKGSNRKVRCLHKLLNKCEMMSSAYFPIHEYELEYHQSIHSLARISGVNLEAKDYRTQSNFIKYLKSVLESEKVKSSLEGLRKVRNKYIAHNEHDPNLSGLNSFWDDCFYLMSIAKLFLSIIGQLFFSTSYRMEDDVKPNTVDFNTYNNAYWLVEFLEKFIGEDKLIEWWLWNEG